MTILLIVVGAAYFIFPFLSTPLLFIGLYKDKKNYKWYISGLVLNLAFIGYYYIPSPSNDLYRHFLSMDLLSNLPISDVFSFQPLILQNIWFYLVGITENYSLLPLTAVIFTYFFVLLAIFHFGIKEKFSQKIILSFILTIIVWWQLIWPISGVRNSVAIALFFYGLYNELIVKEKKWLSYILYILALFLHYATFTLLVLRIAMIIFKKINWLFALFILTWSFFIGVFINILNNSNIPYLSGVSNKASLYTGYSNFGNYSLINLGVKLILCIIFIICVVILKKEKYAIYENYKDFYNYGLLISMFCIGALNYLIVLDRFGYLILSMVPIAMMPILKNEKSKIIKSLYILFYIPFLALGLFVQYIYLRQATYEINIFEIFTKNVIRLLFKI